MGRKQGCPFSPSLLLFSYVCGSMCVLGGGCGGSDTGRKRGKVWENVLWILYLLNSGTHRCLSETFRGKKKKERTAYFTCLFIPAVWLLSLLVSRLFHKYWGVEKLHVFWKQEEGPSRPWGPLPQTLSIWSVYATDPGMEPVSHHHEKQWSLWVFSPFGGHTSPLAPMPYPIPVRLWNKRGSIGVVASSPLFLRAVNWDPGNTGQLLFV